MSYAKIYRYIFEGKLQAQGPSAKCYLFPDKPATLRNSGSFSMVKSPNFVFQRGIKMPDR